METTEILLIVSDQACHLCLLSAAHALPSKVLQDCDFPYLIIDKTELQQILQTSFIKI